MKANRGKLDDTLAAMFSNVNYRDSYLFYAHIIGQTSIKIRDDLPAPAGVAYSVDHYNLYINPHCKWIPITEMKPEHLGKIQPEDLRTNASGEDEVRVGVGFDSFTLVERLAILKHEVLHILLGHVDGTRNAGVHGKRWNYAADCAENQQIDPGHLPGCAVTPASMSKAMGVQFPLNESTEFYYNLIKDEIDKSQGDGEGEPLDDHGGMDTHDTWGESKGDGELQEDITKKMIEKAQDETIKSKGTVPSACSEWIKLHSRKSEVNWRKVLRGIVGNKRVGSRSTIMKQDRRFPKRPDLRGKTKDRMFNLLVVADVSGSMSDLAVTSTLAEVQHICGITKTDVDLIQVDSEAYEPEKLTKTTKTMKRKGHGGTTLFPAIEMATQHRIDYQAVIVLTDGGLFGNDIEQFSTLKKRVMWLVETGGDIDPAMREGRMQAFKLRGQE